MIPGIVAQRRRLASAGEITFGNSGDDGDYFAFGDEINLVAFTTPADMGSVIRLTVPLGSVVIAGRRLKGVIYTKTGANTTGALVAQTPQVVLEASQPSVDLTFPSPVALSASTEYWFGTYHGDSLRMIDTGAGATFYTDFFPYFGNDPPSAPDEAFTVFNFSTAYRLDVIYTPA